MAETTEVRLSVRMDAEKVKSFESAVQRCEEAYSEFLAAVQDTRSKMHDLELKVVQDDIPLRHDDETIFKVHEALRLAGIESEQTRTDAVNMMQNAGIFFRERA